MKEEFEKLLKMFSSTSEGKPVKLEEILQSSLGLFEQLKEKLQEGNPEQKAELSRLLKDMHTKLTTEAEALIKKSGMKEEDLLAFNENPANFTKDQWAVMQEAKKKMLDTTAMMGRINRDSTSKESGPSDEKAPRLKKDSWVRS